MTVVAGIDIGNSTTEIVLLRVSRAGVVEVVAATRALTRGVKGERDSIHAAARLARRTAEKHGVPINTARMAPLHPVVTRCRSVDQIPVDTGPLWLVTREATTASGNATGVGRPVLLPRLRECGEEPAVVLVDSHNGYDHAATLINKAVSDGRKIAAVLVERDEAVLIANRLSAAVPVIDQVPIGELESTTVVAVEARPEGQPLRHLGDPYWVASTFGLAAATLGIQTLVRELEDASYAVVALRPREAAAPVPKVDSTYDEVVWESGAREALDVAVPRIRTTSPGAIVAVGWSDDDHEQVEDVYAVALTDIARGAHTRRGTIHTDSIVTAILRARETRSLDADAELSDALGVPVELVESEVAAGRAGVLSTPGVPAGAVVVDLGGGTVDVSDGAGHCVLAGAGEMLTRITAEALDVPMGTAEYAKRGPALHLDAPQVVVDENGARAFLDAPAPSSAVGALCIKGPVGLAPFNRALGLGEWRAWRTTAKAQSVGHNVGRAMVTIGLSRPASVVLAGGAAGDDEMIAAVARSLPEGSIIGRANVAGRLGHRFAVAYGLARGGASLS